MLRPRNEFAGQGRRPLLPSADVAIIGGGLVGAAIGWGLRRLGRSVVLLDEGDQAFRASRGNFGLVWVQGKGLGFPAYSHLTLDAAEAWPGFAAALTEETGISPCLTAPGGYAFCFTEEELAAKSAAMALLSAQTGGRFQFRVLDREALRQALPWIGPTLAGAIRSEHDRAANPLALLRGLHAALHKSGAHLRTDAAVTRITPEGGGFTLSTAGGDISCGQVVLAAGLGNRSLAPMVGLNAPLRPVRGQILVTERLRPFLADATNVLRQMPEGSCLIGDTSEEVGFDTGVTTKALSWMSERALRLNPALRHVRIMRSWGALRVMTPDGLPLYQQSEAYPGAIVATVHSGVTLAPVHADRLARAIAEGRMPDSLMPFHGGRFTANGTTSEPPAAEDNPPQQEGASRA